MHLDGKHQQLYRPLLKLAWQNHCLVHPELDAKDKAVWRAWYESNLMACIGYKSTSEPRWTARLFDRLCIHFAALSGDDASINYWSRCDERRILWVIRMILEAMDLSIDYAQGIARRMGFFVGSIDTIDELPEAHLWRVAIAVNKHGIRELGRDIWAEICGRVDLPKLKDEEAEEPLPF